MHLVLSIFLQDSPDLEIGHTWFEMDISLYQEETLHLAAMASNIDGKDIGLKVLVLQIYKTETISGRWMMVEIAAPILRVNDKKADRSHWAHFTYNLDKHIDSINQNADIQGYKSHGWYSPMLFYNFLIKESNQFKAPKFTIILYVVK